MIISYASALEVNEKLKVRVISLSSSKKTMLINRGLEDGIKVGDHATFYLPIGTIANAFVRSTSPTRSIWSVNQLIKPEQLNKDRLFNLKAFEYQNKEPDSPEKLTYYPSKKEREKRLSETQQFSLTSTAPLSNTKTQKDNLAEIAYRSRLKAKDMTYPDSAEVDDDFSEYEESSEFEIAFSLIKHSLEVTSPGSSDESDQYVEGSETGDGRRFRFTLTKNFSNANSFFKGFEISPFIEYQTIGENGIMYSGGGILSYVFFNQGNTPGSFAPYIYTGFGYTFFSVEDSIGNIESKLSLKGEIYISGIGVRYFFNRKSGMKIFGEMVQQNLAGAYTISYESNELAFDSTLVFRGSQFGLSYVRAF